MKGGDPGDQHAVDRDAEAEYFLAEFNIDIKTDSHSYDRHGADTEGDYHVDRILGNEDPSPYATRFLSEDHHMMCRERCVAVHFNAMNTPEAIARGQFTAPLTFTEPIGEGIGNMSFAADDAPEVQVYMEVYTAVFVFRYDTVAQQWREVTGYPNARASHAAKP